MFFCGEGGKVTFLTKSKFHIHMDYCIVTANGYNLYFSLDEAEGNIARQEGLSQDKEKKIHRHHYSYFQNVKTSTR